MTFQQILIKEKFQSQWLCSRITELKTYTSLQIIASKTPLKWRFAGGPIIARSPDKRFWIRAWRFSKCSWREISTAMTVCSRITEHTSISLVYAKLIKNVIVSKSGLEQGHNADRLARTSENLTFTDSPTSQPLSFFEFDHLNVFTLECLSLNMSGKMVCERHLTQMDRQSHIASQTLGARLSI